MPWRQSAPRASRQRDLLYGILLAAVAAAPFVTVWDRQFTNWDDRGNIVENGAVRWLTMTNAGYLFTHAIGGNYVPLTWISHALDWRVSGDDAWAHALTNAFWHAVCCCLVVACLRRGGLDARASWLAGFFFAVHPIHAENVAWISGRKDLLCSAALLACQYSYMGWRHEGRRSSWVWSLLWLIAAGLCKPTAMSAVIGLGLYDVVWLRHPWRKACLALLPHAFVCAGVAVVAVFAQRSGAAFPAAADRRWGAIDLAACNLLYELVRCWLPVPFSPFLPNSILEDVPVWIRWTGTIMLVGASAGILFRSSASRVRQGVAWWWFGALAFLLPVSGLIPLGHTSLADRYLYLPSLGPCVFLALGLGSLAPHLSKAAVGVAYILVVGLACETHQRAAAWADSFSLWRSTLATFPQCGLAWQNLTTAYFQSERLDEAAETAIEGLKSVPDDLHTQINAVALLIELGRLTEADEVLAAAETRRPREPELLNQRGILALRRLRPGEARAFLESALDQRPEWEEPYLNLTYAFEQLHDLPRALEAAHQAVKFARHDSEAARRLVALLLKDRRTDEALIVLQEMTAAFPHDADAWRNRIILLRQSGRAAEAEQAARDSARFVPPISLD